MNTLESFESLEIVVKTDPGMVRSHNEDAVFGQSDGGLVCWPTAWAATTPARWPAAWRRPVLSTELEVRVCHLLAG
jgi:hypothetical protein